MCLLHRALSSSLRAVSNWDWGPGQAVVLRGCTPRSKFTGCFPANSQELSAQIDINLGRKLVRTGRCWVAIRAALVPAV